jgi:hypothetical protein
MVIMKLHCEKTKAVRTRVTSSSKQTEQRMSALEEG